MTAPTPRPLPWPPQPTPYARRLTALHRARRAAWRASRGNRREFRRLMAAWLAAGKPPGTVTRR